MTINDESVNDEPQFDESRLPVPRQIPGKKRGRKPKFSNRFRRVLIEEIEAGLSVSEAARKHMVTTRQVWDLVSKPRAGEPMLRGPDYLAEDPLKEAAIETLITDCTARRRWLAGRVVDPEWPAPVRIKAMEALQKSCGDYERAQQMRIVHEVLRYDVAFDAPPDPNAAIDVTPRPAIEDRNDLLSRMFGGSAASRDDDEDSDPDE